MVFGGRFFTPFSVGSISFTQLFSDTMSSLLHSEHSSKYNSYVYSPIDLPRIHSKEHTEEVYRKMLGMDSRLLSDGFILRIYVRPFIGRFLGMILWKLF